ncbi:MAG TPA: tetratricopeptide repeat protein [Verrucomicrobiae bacterium]|nr:tetratricopeptide repeat protein [Verrucomicrobiae bacterium]
MFTAKLTKHQLFAAICLGLALGTFAVYWPMTHHDFVSFDDQAYITSNQHVLSGLTWTNVVWAFKSTESANWHPLTWISHMADCQIYGVKAGGHHFTNLLFHVANTLLLFLLLERTTGALWRSAFVAAFFAWHPLHVESVAWAAERKDVLSTFFWMLTLLAYARFVQKLKAVNQNLPANSSRFRFLTSRFYWLALFFFACGLMSKPMVVTLPFVLLLLDFWPLNRLGLNFYAAEKTISVGKFFSENLARKTIILICEKIPFFALSLAGCLMTLRVQKEAMAPVSAFSRMESVLLTYARYLSKTFWPADLAIVYPYHYSWPTVFVIGTAVLLLIWSGLFVFYAQRNPYLMVGWFWFLGTLVPTIGIIQVGAQSMADRYMYIPSIGLFIIIVWGANDLFNLWPKKRNFLPLIGGVALAGCLMVTSIQLTYWQNSFSLFLHAIEVTKGNYVAENCLGKAFESIGENNRALVLYEDAVKIQPRFPESQFNLAMSLLAFGKIHEAFDHLRMAAELEPKDADIQYDLAVYFSQHGGFADAARGFRTALTLRPDFFEAQTRFGMLLTREKKIAEAIPHFAEAVRLKPADADARFNLGLALLDNHQPAKAEIQFNAELGITPHETKVHFRLAQALAQQNKLADAVAHYREALRCTPDFPEANLALNQILAAHPELAKPPALDSAK